MTHPDRTRDILNIVVGIEDRWSTVIVLGVGGSILLVFVEVRNGLRGTSLFDWVNSWRIDMGALKEVLNKGKRLKGQSVRSSWKSSYKLREKRLKSTSSQSGAVTHLHRFYRDTKKKSKWRWKKYYLCTTRNMKDFMKINRDYDTIQVPDTIEKLVITLYVCFCSIHWKEYCMLSGHFRCNRLDFLQRTEIVVRTR